MTLKIIPINMYAAPNAWAPTKDTFWTVTDATAIDLWGQIVTVDPHEHWHNTLRPYVPAVGSSLVALFQRGDYIGSLTNLNLTVTKVATMDSNFRAMIKISISSADATNITSGTIVLTLTEGTVVNKWAQNWAIKKLNTSAGF